MKNSFWEILKDLFNSSKYFIWIVIVLLTVSIYSSQYLLPFLKEVYFFFTILSLLDLGIIALAVAIGMVFGMFPATFVAFFSAFLYGVWAFPFILIMYMVAQNLGYFLARLIPPFFMNSNSNIANAIKSAIQNKSRYVIFWLRLSPAIPFSITNLLFGQLRVPLLQFNVFGLLGMLPRTLFVFCIGLYTKSLVRSEFGLIEILGVVLLFAISIAGFYVSVIKRETQKRGL